MWRNVFSKRTSDLPLPNIPAGEQPFVPAYTPMHGPGAKPIEEAKSGWHPTRLQSSALAIVIAVVIGGGGFVLASRQDTSSKASPTAGIVKDDDLYQDTSSVLGAQTTNEDSKVTSPVQGPNVQKPTVTNPSTQRPVNTKPSPAVIASPQPTPAPATSPSPTPTPAPTPTTPTPAPLPAKTVTSTFANNAFSPSLYTINKGDTVRLINNDAVAVRFVCKGEGACKGETVLNPGGAISFTFPNAGTWTIQKKQEISVTLLAESATLTITVL